MNIDSVTIRPVQTSELETVAHMRAVGFGGDKEKSLNAITNNPRYDSSHILIAEYDGNLIGTGTAFPAQMWLSGVPLSVGAVTGVTILPEFQGNGAAAKLMEHSIAKMHDEEQALSVLFPFSQKYYHKIGYGTVGDLHSYRINRDNLAAFEGSEHVRPFDPDDMHTLRVLYRGELTWHNGWFTRSNEWWDKIIAQWPSIMVFDDGMIGGYYSYHIKTGQNGERVLEIKELFASDDSAFRGLVAYLANQDEADVIEYLAPAHTLLRHSLRQPIAADAQNRGWIFNDLCHITPGPMARIINLSKALTTRFYTRGMSGERTLKVTDPLIPQNEETILFRLVDGRAETHPSSDSKPQIETDIATLTQIVCDYLNPSDARRLGRLNTDGETAFWLDQIIVDTPLYIQAGDWF